VRRARTTVKRFGVLVVDAYDRLLLNRIPIKKEREEETSQREATSVQSTSVVQVTQARISWVYSVAKESMESGF
jgi:endonuclease III-like uncharacterized protein